MYDFKYLSLRLFNVYGPKVRTTGHYGAVFGVFLSQLYNNKPLTIVGNGNQKRDFTYVTDVVSAFIKASNSKNINGIFNVGTGNPISINDVVKLLNVKKKYISQKDQVSPIRQMQTLKKLKKN